MSDRWPPVSRVLQFLAGLAVVLVALPLAVWWTMSVHEPYCPWEEAFWDGDLPAGEGDVRGLLLGSSRTGADVDVVQLAEGTGFAWQRMARHTLSGNSLVPTYPELLTASAASPGLDVLFIEVSPLLFDEVSCGRAPIPHVAMQPQWLGPAGVLGIENRPSALAMTILPHRWLAGSGRRHDLVEHLKAPGHLLTAVADLRHGSRGRIPRWVGEPAPPLTAENAMNRREFLLGQPMSAWVPKVNASCLATLEQVVRVAAAKRTFLVMLPMRPALRDTVEPEYWSGARLALRESASQLPRTALLDFTTRFDADLGQFNDFDHLTAEGAAAFTAELADLFQ